jgi:hypothetical protein
MYESTINIDVVKDGSPQPLSFLYSLQEYVTITGTISGTITVNGMWVNNTLDDRLISTINIVAETQELTEAWADSVQEKAELEGVTIYISVSEG